VHLESHRLVSVDEQRFLAIDRHFDQEDLLHNIQKIQEFIRVHVQDGDR